MIFLKLICFKFANTEKVSKKRASLPHTEIVFKNGNSLQQAMKGSKIGEHHYNLRMVSKNGDSNNK